MPIAPARYARTANPSIVTVWLLRPCATPSKPTASTQSMCRRCAGACRRIFCACQGLRDIFTTEAPTPASQNRACRGPGHGDTERGRRAQPEIVGFLRDYGWKEKITGAELKQNVSRGARKSLEA